MTLTMDSIVSNAALVNKKGSGKVRWRRASASSGSGKDRNAGQFDSRAIESCRISGAYLWIKLASHLIGADGNAYRRIRLDSIIELSAA